MDPITRYSSMNDHYLSWIRQALTEKRQYACLCREEVFEVLLCGQKHTLNQIAAIAINGLLYVIL
jgi:hypothetical protein